MNNISDVINEVSNIKLKYRFSDDLFFRGQRRKDKLLPGLLRKDFKDLDYKENSAYCDCFIMGNNEFSNCNSSWEILAIMQHYGFPTRLLDWSTSLINSIYFACFDCIDCKCKCHKGRTRKKQCHGDPVIWVLNPRRLHEKYHPKLNLLALSVGIDRIQDYKNIFVKTVSSRWKYKNGPVFMEIPWNNPRIKSQKGYFTFHYDDKIIDNKCAVPIYLDDNCRKNILDELKLIGMNEFDIYSDLVSLSRHIRRKYEIN